MKTPRRDERRGAPINLSETNRYENDYPVYLDDDNWIVVDCESEIKPNLGFPPLRLSDDGRRNGSLRITPEGQTMTRFPISKRTRFTVLKRDNFTCQYCGASAPDAVLEIDHVKPVAKGGCNCLTNLITACQDCNRGKNVAVFGGSIERDDLNEKWAVAVELEKLARIEFEDADIDVCHYIVAALLNGKSAENIRENITDPSWKDHAAYWGGMDVARGDFIGRLQGELDTYFMQMECPA